MNTSHRQDKKCRNSSKVKWLKRNTMARNLSGIKALSISNKLRTLKGQSRYPGGQRTTIFCSSVFSISPKTKTGLARSLARFLRTHSSRLIWWICSLSTNIEWTALSGRTAPRNNKETARRTGTMTANFRKLRFATLSQLATSNCRERAQPRQNWHFDLNF